MSFVYIPIPGFSSVREETQLHAALPAAHRVRGGTQPQSLRLVGRPPPQPDSNLRLARVLFPVLVKPFYNLAWASSCALSLLFF